MTVKNNTQKSLDSKIILSVIILRNPFIHIRIFYDKTFYDFIFPRLLPVAKNQHFSFTFVQTCKELVCNHHKTCTVNLSGPIDSKCHIVYGEH